MKYQLSHTVKLIGTTPLLLAISILVSSAGCSSLPWRSKKPPVTAEYEAYIDQAVSNPTFEPSYQTTAVDGSTLPPPVVSPSDRVADAGGGCNDGCCH